MDLAVNTIDPHRIPALFMSTTIYLLIFGLVLPEVKSFNRVYFRTHSLDEVLIINYPIAIFIEIVENVVKVLLVHVHTPVIEIEFQVFLRYGPIFAYA